MPLRCRGVGAGLVGQGETLRRSGRTGAAAEGKIGEMAEDQGGRESAVPEGVASRREQGKIIPDFPGYVCLQGGVSPSGNLV